jgi:hypothetical protein
MNQHCSEKSKFVDFAMPKSLENFNPTKEEAILVNTIEVGTLRVGKEKVTFPP